jgi:hypothetical protein
LDTWIKRGDGGGIDILLLDNPEAAGHVPFVEAKANLTD